LIQAARRLLWAALLLSALFITARAIFGPFRLGVPVTSPMNSEGVFALSGAGLIATARKTRGGTWPPPKLSFPLAVAILGIAAVVCYAWTFRFPFLADDYDHIPNAIHATPASLEALFTHPAADRFFRPAAFVLYADEARVAGFSRAGWHALSLALHLAVTILLYVFARRRFGAWPSLAAAMLFLLHGSRPEAVTWIAAQFDLWAALFFLAALLAFERGWRALSLAPLLLALLSKESAYVYPLALLLVLFVDRVPVKQWPRLAAPSFLLTVVVFVYRLWLLGGIGGYRDTGTGRPYILTFDVLRTAKALTARLGAALEFPVNWTLPPEWWLIVALIAAMTASALLFRSKADSRKLSLGFGFLVLAALPVHEFLLIDADLEKSRVLYLPSIGLALIFAVLLEAARLRIGIAAAAAILVFQAAALEHDLRIWASISRLAANTCAAVAATPGPVAVSDIANTIDGVYFLHTGLRGCIEAAGKPEGEIYLAGETSPPNVAHLDWNTAARRFTPR
jgi:hypothetical protein